MRRCPRVVSTALLYFTYLLAGCAETPTPTPLESAGGDVLTSYDAMMSFLGQLEDETHAFTMDTLGLSGEGRALLALHFSGSAGAEPIQEGKLKVLVYAQQHGDEPSGKEAAIALVRDISTGAYSDFLEDVDFYLVPQLNPDGSEARQRRNAEGQDLNRDHLTLNTPEVAALHKLFNEVRPHVTLDVHEYGFAGSTWVEAGLHKDFGQQIGGLSNPNMSLALREYAWNRVIPSMAEALAPRNVVLQRYLVTDGPEARFRYSTTALNDGRNSMGIYHSLSFLIEGRNGLTVEADIRERARQQLETIKAFLDFFADNAEEVKTLVGTEKEALTAESLPAEVAIVMDYVPDPARPTVTVGVIDIDSGEAGSMVIEAFHPQVETTLAVTRPAGYVIPGGAKEVIAVLERHGIPFERVEDPITATLETYRIDAVTPATMEDKDFLDVEVTATTQDAAIPVGDVLVTCDQPASNLIVTLLEPQSMWGLAPLPQFVSMLAVGSDYPIRRISRFPG